MIPNGTLQNDLNGLSLWATTWLMEFNPLKCKVLHIGPHNNQISYYMLEKSGTHIQVEAVESEQDLGVTVDRKFKFHEHTLQQVAEANRALGLIKQTISSCHPLIIRKLYNALVRPHLEFGCPVTNHQYKGDVAALENIQRRATKLCVPHQQLPYPECLHCLKIPTLVYWQHKDAIFVKKMHQNNMANSIFTPSLATTIRGHSKKLQQELSRCRARMIFSSVHTVRTWNSLSNETVTGELINSFKNRVDLEWSNGEWKY